MNVRVRFVVAIAALALVVGIAPTAVGGSPDGAPVDITTTAKGRDVAGKVAARHSSLGVATTASELKVWKIGADDYFIGNRLPDNFKTKTAKQADGSTSVEFSYDVGVASESAARSLDAEAGTQAVAAAASWAFKSRACFSRFGDASFGFLDSCYIIDKLINESDPRDYYKLEQYGTLGAGTLTKMYSGYLKGVKASSGSSAMSWVDWNPRGSKSGPCQDLNLKVAALGVNFTTPAFFCETNTPTKYAAAGSFMMAWSCGCIYPLGQPYPNSREIDYLQAVSVTNGGSVRWTLSQGMSHR